MYEYSILNSTADRHLGSLQFGINLLTGIHLCDSWTLTSLGCIPSNMIGSSQGTQRLAMVDIAKQCSKMLY